MATTSRKAAAAPVIPKTVGGLVDMIYQLQESRLVLQREVDALEEKEKALIEHLRESAQKQDLDGAMGKLAKVKLGKQLVPTIDAENGGWDKFWAYVFKTKQTNLVQKRLTTKACQELWDEGKTIPGVKKFERDTISITKI